MKALAKILLDITQSLYVNFLRLFGFFKYPVPPNSCLRKTSSHTISDYYISGIRTYLPIAVAAIQNGVEFNSESNILDFGCGVGRQLLHFKNWYPKPEYYACDVDSSCIDFIDKKYPSINSHTNDFSPPLYYDDEMFNFVYSVSTFSHFDQESQQAWLNELGRITKPGGICVLTTEGSTALEDLQPNLSSSIDNLTKELEEQGYIYKEYKNLNIERQSKPIFARLTPMAGIDGSYGNMVLTRSYIFANWNTHFFKVLEVIEGVIDHRQDLVVLKRLNR